MKRTFVLLVLILNIKIGLAQNEAPVVFKIVEQMPEYQGGEHALYKFISDNVRYPDSAIKYNKEARIRVKFVINEDGKITNVQTTNIHAGFGLEEEAKRVIASMPNWKPGRNNGVPVKVYFQIPINFTLQDKQVDLKTPPNIESTTTTIPEEKNIFTYVEQMPEFSGGETAMYKYIADNIKYPEQAQKDGLEGKVYVKFIVLASGQVINAISMKHAGHGFDTEAIRVVNAMPKWKPGKQNGRPVDVYFQIPIYFKLEKESAEK